MTCQFKTRSNQRTTRTLHENRHFGIARMFVAGRQVYFFI